MPRFKSKARSTLTDDIQKLVAGCKSRPQKIPALEELFIPLAERRWRCRGCYLSSQICSNASGEFPYAKRLGQVVVGACIEPRLLFVDRTVSGEDDNRCFPTGCTKSLENVYTVYVRHVPIQDYQFVFVTLE